MAVRWSDRRERNEVKLHVMRFTLDIIIKR